MKIRSRLVVKCLAWLIVHISQLLLRSCRVIYLAPEPWLQLNHAGGPAEMRRGVLCVWHDLLLIPTFAAPRVIRRQTCCLVSKHQDGTYLADTMYILGYATVRGSTKRGGAAAVKQLIDDTAGKHIVITPDGPRGPRRKLKPGAIYVASQTGKPVCPGAYACSNAWRIPGSWTDAIIPKPFSTVYVVTGSPLPIPADISRDRLEHYVNLVQAAMDQLHDQVEKLARGEITRLEFTPFVWPASQQAA